MNINNNVQQQPRTAYYPQYFPQSQYYQQPPNNWYPMQNVQTSSPSNDVDTNIKWVYGEEAAKSFMMPNNATYALWDTEIQRIYVKTVDANGRPFMKRLDYVDIDEPIEQKEETPEYVTQEQLNALSEDLSKQLADLQKKLNDFKSKMCNTNAKKEKG